jgi:hypothetical protein
MDEIGSHCSPLSDREERGYKVAKIKKECALSAKTAHL